LQQKLLQRTNKRNTLVVQGFWNLGAMVGITP